MAAKRGRTIRREQQHADAKLVRAREALEQLAPGADAANPIAVESASQIEVRARAVRCPVCGDAYRVVEHEAITTPCGARRVVAATSPQCGRTRSIYFAIRPALAN